MNSKSIIANTLLAITFLMSSMRVSGMEKESTLLDVSRDKISLEDIVKTTVALSGTCKRFQKEMPVIFGKFCKDHYDITEKNKVMEKLFHYVDYYILNYQYEHYQNGRRAALTLVHAGANNIANGRSLLRKSIYQKDKEMIAALFKNNVNPNQHAPLYEHPDWFAIDDVDILEMFVARGLKLEQIEGKQDVLRHAIVYHHNSKLIEWYLEHNVDPKKINTITQDNILHFFVNCKDSWPDVDDYVQACVLLAKAAPGLIYKTNKYGRSPICQMRAELSSMENMELDKRTYGYSAKKKFEAILKIYGDSNFFNNYKFNPEQRIL